MIKDGKSLVSWRQWSKSNQAPTSTPTMIWTREQVSAHNILNDFWCILQGKVYNLTPFLEYHPGGIKILKPYAGKDVTTMFEKYHAWVNFELILECCCVGQVLK